MVAPTPEGADLIVALSLNLPPALEVRRHRLLLLRLIRSAPDTPDSRDLLLAEFGYPADLSALRPPGGNSRPEGVARSHHARRQRGELPKAY